jgi:putative ABC transport system permease protein
VNRVPVLGLGTLWQFYRARLRTQATQELLGGVGIAAGVALIFAVQIANTSVTGSVEQLVQGVTGDASLQVAARGDTTVDAGVAKEVEGVRGAHVVAPALDRRVVIAGPSGNRTVDLLGVTPALAGLHGKLMAGLGRHGLRLSRALVLPEPLAAAIGVSPGETARLRIGGVEKPVAVSVTVPTDQYGDLAGSPVALAPLAYVQRLTGLDGRVSRVLVSTFPGREDAVRDELRARFGRTLDVVPADIEAHLIRQAAAPSDQSTRLFAAISALVGALFAFTAMLLTVPERRRFIAELRLQGFSTSQVTAQIAFESLLLGGVASLIGLVLGDQLSRHAIEPLAGALAFAFPVGEQRVVTGGAVALSLTAGIVVTFVAGARPLVDIFSTAPLDSAIRGDGEPPDLVLGRRRRVMLGGLALVAATTAVVLLLPGLTVAAPAGLAIGLVLVLPAAFYASMRVLAAVSRRANFGLAAVAASELTTSPTRSIALACTVALALFGNVAIEGAHHDLLRGLDQVTHELSEPADVWVIPSAAGNTLATMPLSDRRLAKRLEHTPEVARTRSYRSAFLDTGGRRLWVIGRPTGENVQIARNQVVGGDASLISPRLRAGGWAAVTDAVADERGLRLGQPFTLPTPTGPRQFRLAARITNFGWAPGTIIIGASDHRSAWGERAPTAIEVDLKPGVKPAAGRAAVAAAIGDRALDVQTTDERWASQRAVAREGLSRLSHIATLALLCTIFAVAAATSAGLWQRRGALAELRIHGFSWLQLWGVLLIETAVLIGCGGLIGLIFGLYGQGLAARWLELDTGFPTVYAPAILPALSTLAIVTVSALAMAALPGLAAARAPLSLGFKEE